MNRDNQQVALLFYKKSPVDETAKPVIDLTENCSESGCPAVL
jgi:hypothetical protein